MDKENNNDKKVTTDDLAVMVKKGFDKMDNGFEEAKKERKGITKRLETIEKNQGRDDRRVTKLEDDMRVVKTKVGIED